MKNIALIGATGSIGRQVLDVVRRHGDKYRIVALAAGRASREFSALVSEFKPERFAAASVDYEGALSVAETQSADIVFNAAGGFAGLEYSIRAIDAGKTLALANKETLVCGGSLVTGLASRRGVGIIPVDSEHSAIWQCLHFDRKQPFKRLIITASGGAFRGKKQSELKTLTPAEALNHPTWKMGEKITVDSATLLNKGYEIIEAHVLFGADYDDVEAVIQPTSVVHSLVEFADGACLAQMGEPSMEVPIQLALSYPQRFETSVKALDFKKAFSVNFEPLKSGEYPLFDLALGCGRTGGVMPCALNAADEVAVRAFLDGKIAFTDVYAVVSRVISETPYAAAESFKQLKEVDRVSRERAQKIINGL